MEMSGQSTTLYRTPSSFSRKGEGRVARSSAKEFRFDHSYWSVNASDEHYATQEQVYSDLGLPVIQAAFAGYNSCMFAYGQTGSGKTYTMTGYDTEVGLIPRICGVGRALVPVSHLRLSVLHVLSSSGAVLSHRERSGGQVCLLQDRGQVRSHIAPVYRGLPCPQ